MLVLAPSFHRRVHRQLFIEIRRARSNCWQFELGQKPPEACMLLLSWTVTAGFCASVPSTDLHLHSYGDVQIMLQFMLVIMPVTAGPCTDCKPSTQTHPNWQDGVCWLCARQVCPGGANGSAGGSVCSAEPGSSRDDCQADQKCCGQPHRCAHSLHAKLGSPMHKLASSQLAICRQSMMHSSPWLSFKDTPSCHEKML